MFGFGAEQSSSETKVMIAARAGPAFVLDSIPSPIQFWFY